MIYAFATLFDLLQCVNEVLAHSTTDAAVIHLEDLFLAVELVGRLD